MVVPSETLSVFVSTAAPPVTLPDWHAKNMEMLATASTHLGSLDCMKNCVAHLIFTFYAVDMVELVSRNSRIILLIGLPPDGPNMTTIDHPKAEVPGQFTTALHPKAAVGLIG